jgi:hypothetical protein
MFFIDFNFQESRLMDVPLLERVSMCSDGEIEATATYLSMLFKTSVFGDGTLKEQKMEYVVRRLSRSIDGFEQEPKDGFSEEAQGYTEIIFAFVEHAVRHLVPSKDTAYKIKMAGNIQPVFLKKIITDSSIQESIEWFMAEIYSYSSMPRFA